MAHLGKLLVALGLGLAALGVVLWLGSRLAGLGRLPGDFTLRRDGLTVYLPIGTSILLSLALTFLLNVLWRR